MPAVPHPRQVAVSQGWRWITAGFGLFAKSPVLWVTFFLVYFFTTLLLSFTLPFLGAVLAGLLDPLFIAGFMVACRALEVGEEMDIAHLFAGFRQRARPLAALGALFLTGKVLMVMVTALIAAALGFSMPEMDFRALESADPETVAEMMHQVLVFLALFLALVVPLLMAYWFAPALVIFDELSPVDAFKTSFKACLMNIWPFTLFGVAGLALLLLAALPLALGLLIVTPVLFGTALYASYRDIFVTQG